MAPRGPSHFIALFGLGFYLEKIESWYVEMQFGRIRFYNYIINSGLGSSLLCDPATDIDFSHCLGMGYWHWVTR